MGRAIIANGSGAHEKGLTMSGPHDPGDPMVHRKRTGWQRLKGWPLAVIIIVGCLILFVLFAGVVTALMQALGLSA
ncbi:hypothetical protein AB0L65_33125 [Nonomuraea sp. NPDC052116]|uniref:hypothetical protein n=1 Tax=Nonomuraea sp. NPDC052116 TaxID=3155665 RepID=UPI0034459861